MKPDKPHDTKTSDSDARLSALEDRVAKLEKSSLHVTRIDPGAIYTVSEAADFLRCAKSNVYDLVSSRLIATVKVGAGNAGFRMVGKDILAFIESRRSGGPKPLITFENLRGKFREPT